MVLDELPHILIKTLTGNILQVKNTKKIYPTIKKHNKTMNEQDGMEPLAQRLKEKLDSMSKEELERKWNELNHYNDNCPTIDEISSEMVAWKKEMIDKAAKWLTEETLPRLALSVDDQEIVKEFVDDFKQAMECLALPTGVVICTKGLVGNYKKSNRYISRNKERSIVPALPTKEV